MNSSPVPFVISYQRLLYSLPDMLQYNAEITLIIIMSAYHALGTLLRCFFPIILLIHNNANSIDYYYSQFIEEKIKV